MDGEEFNIAKISSLNQIQAYDSDGSSSSDVNDSLEVKVSSKFNGSEEVNDVSVLIFFIVFIYFYNCFNFFKNFFNFLMKITYYLNLTQYKAA